jgi:hypothetical protein
MPSHYDANAPTAINPKTGERLILDREKNKWIPMGGAAALEGSGISPLPIEQQDIELGISPAAKVDLPFSVMDILEYLPGIGGAAGAVAGSPAGPGGMAAVGGLGAGAGEALRQEFREAMGYAPATGMVQEAVDLDPESAAARGAGVAAETGMGALTELLGPLVGRLGKGLTKSGLKSRAKAIAPAVPEREIDELMEAISLEKELRPPLSQQKGFGLGEPKLSSRVEKPFQKPTSGLLEP